MSEINYTITSGDINNYSMIRESLLAPHTQMTEFIVTGLTTMCSFVILDEDDFIEFVLYSRAESVDENQNPSFFVFQWDSKTSHLTPYKFAEFAKLNFGDKLNIKFTDSDLLSFYAKCRIAIKNMSYRMKLVLGMTDVEFTQRTYYFVYGQLDNEIELTTDDYLEIDGVKYYSKNKYETPMTTLQLLINIETGRTLLQDGFEIYFNHIRRLMMHRFDKTFMVTDATMNIIKMTRFATVDENTKTIRFHSTLADSKYSIESERMFLVESKKARETDTIDDKDFIKLVIGFDSFTAGIPYDRKVIGKYTINKNDNITILTILREMLPELTILIYDDGIQMRHNDVFAIIGISEKFSKVTGFIVDYTMYMRNTIELPTKSYFNLTPVLYLASNIGSVVHTYKNKNCVNRRILMRINNFFNQDFPIICYNSEFSSTITSNSLSDVWFQLVDANFQPIQLLAPMYLTAIAIPIPDRTLKYVPIPLTYSEPNE